MKTNIRWMKPADAARVSEIDMMCFPGSAWGVEKISKLMKDCLVILVADTKEGILAYLVYEVRSKTLKLTRLGVHPEFRRRGIATRMLDAVFERLPGINRNAIVADVDEHEPVWVCQWLCRWGFKPTKVDHKAGTYRFVRSLNARVVEV